MARWINRHPSSAGRWTLAALPFVLVLVVYGVGSSARQASNPDDKLLPSGAQLVASVQRLAFEPSRRTGELVLWKDTATSMRLLLFGLLASFVVALALGIVLGTLPYASAFGGAFLTALAMVPPLALLPILFILFGLGDLSKVLLIAIGITPAMARDLSQYVARLPREQLVKAQTLGASTTQIVMRVVLPQALPRAIENLRLALGAAWLFLIAAEAIAATDGLGYRIFLVRRYLAMDVILPYVLWITALAFLLDSALKWLSHWLFPWHRVAYT
ncbi:MAG: ABC transporter permease subunit [Pseudomonadota bacterium]|nr:ABC transporter permease subunit [Pseudomonadota bacterium]